MHCTTMWRVEEKKSKKICGNLDNDLLFKPLSRNYFFGEIQCLGLSGPPNTAKSMVLGKKAPSGLSPIHPLIII